MKQFEELVAWQKARQFAVIICSEFSKLSDFDFRNQIRRAAVSICNNIAEGFGRRTTADYLSFLYYSISSNSEVKCMLYLAEDLGYCTPERAAQLREISEEVARIIRGLIISLQAKK
jgi:four helix bundle protein